ncbi:alpha/beta hydrolase [Pseudonocardia nigra]|uniref:alpha/beta hydrolase n=1 Tax=Pseudonocardia nigra TaxID=1921578 RepID=UPI001C5D60C1|nr:alpha/beta hydrolase [Pseudonocardia nigra]
MIRRVATVAGVAGVLAAAGARRPVLRRWPASLAQMLPCLPASEAPGPLTAAHAALGALSLARGGVAGAVANAAAVAALAGLRGDAARSAEVLESALASLGPAAPDPRNDGRVASGRSARKRNLRAADVAYGDEPDHRLDVWASPGLAAGAGAPVLVQVHGGAWTMGDKSVSAAPLMAHLAERGWVCVTINYRLGPGERWPAMIVDVKRAIAWVKENIADHGGDPGFVAISGGSAGGHLAALAALSPNDRAFQPGFADADTSLAAAVPLYGVFDFSVDEYGLFALLEGKVMTTTSVDDPHTWQQASPVHRAGPHAPPFLVVHGTADTVASVGQSQRFVQRLREVSEQPVFYAELPRAQHGFDELPTARTGHVVRAVHRFLTAAHERYRAG